MNKNTKNIENEGKGKPVKLKPSDYLKARRPERYSDSIFIEEPKLNRSILEYHLSTLASHSEELQFENFARKLLQKDVCPNLIPQTGPTAGGDGKVDSETYPVSKEISLRWYVHTESGVATVFRTGCLNSFV